MRLKGAGPAAGVTSLSTANAGVDTGGRRPAVCVDQQHSLQRRRLLRKRERSEGGAERMHPSQAASDECTADALGIRGEARVFTICCMALTQLSLVQYQAARHVHLV